MTEYVCVCPMQQDDRVLLIERHSDPYRGYLSLVGGKVERGETSEQAAARELTEESKFIGRNFRCRGLVEVPGKALVWFYTCIPSNIYQIPIPEGIVRWHRLPDVLYNQQWPVVPNLRFIIPLLMGNAPSWIITENSPNELMIRGWL